MFLAVRVGRRKKKESKSKSREQREKGRLPSGSSFSLVLTQLSLQRADRPSKLALSPGGSLFLGFKIAPKLERNCRGPRLF